MEMSLTELKSKCVYICKYREADCSTGYSPILSFEVDDMDSTIQRIMMLGGRLDGPIKYPIEGKIASVRSPDGHMIGLFEANLDLV